MLAAAAAAAAAAATAVAAAAAVGLFPALLSARVTMEGRSLRSPFRTSLFASLDYPYFPLLARSLAPCPGTHGRHPTSGAAAFETRSVT